MMSEKERRILEVLSLYEQGMVLIGGCGDGNCVIAQPGGMHTNGGCRCHTDRTKALRAMSRARWLAEEIRKVVT
jgi:hypothetical protein